jgi:hypothetical protein
MKIFLISLLMVLGCVNSGVASCFTTQVLFSNSSGFYEQSFVLYLSHPHDDAIIRYTTDGSDPDENSDIYHEGIEIIDRSNEPLNISMIPSGENWKPPGAVNRQAMVVAARAFVTGCNPSSVTYAVYFVNENNAFEHKIPLISIVTDKDNLFDQQTGIYAMGNGVIPNYDNSGEEWERPVFLEFFEPDGARIYSNGAGIRIHGGTSRKFPQKGLRLYFRKEYGNSWLRQEVFSDYPVREFKRLLLRPSGHDDSFSMIRDGLMSSLMKNTHVDRMAFRPSVLYINGEYWGIHNIRERLDKYYVSTHHGVDPENIDFLFSTHHEPSEGDDKHFVKLIDFLNKNDLSKDSVFQYVSTQMDVESYTDYKIGEIFFYRWDIGNIRHWRERSPDGRWRWMMFDLDTGYGGFWAIDEPWNFNMLRYNTEPNGPWTHLLGHDHNQPKATLLLRKLLENEKYRETFVTRFADLLNTNFLPSVAHSLIDEYSKIIEEEIPYQILRWNRIESVDYWHAQLEHMKDFSSFRPTIQRQQILEFFNIASTFNLIVDVGDSNSGHVKVNTIEIQPSIFGISEEPFPWKGVYFKGHPISVTAVPAYGYEFSHWEGADSTSNPDIIINPDGDSFIKAHFVRTSQSIIIHNWLFDTRLPNDTPLQSILPGFSQVPGGQLAFESCLPGYPYHNDHALWRKASMERRNKPTHLNYKPEANGQIPFDQTNMRGLQVRQPFTYGDKHNTLIFHLPTTGYSDIALSMAIINEQAVKNMKIEYCINEQAIWTTAGLTEPERFLSPDIYHLNLIDFRGIKETNHNPEFKVRLTFDGDQINMDFGKRITFNNISLEGIPMVTHIINCTPTTNGKVEPSGIIKLFQGDDVHFYIMPEDGFELEDIILDGISVESQISWIGQNKAHYCLENIHSDHDLKVTFSAILTDEKKHQVVLSPNPAFHTVKVESIRTINKIELSTLGGEIVYRQTFTEKEVEATIDIANLNNGIYIVSVYTVEGRFARKLFVTR